MSSEEVLPGSGHLQSSHPGDLHRTALWCFSAASPQPLPTKAKRVRLSGGVYLITSGRKVRKELGGKLVEEDEPPFDQLSAFEKAQTLQRQRKSSIVPIGAPLFHLASFRRDDEILTDIDTLVHQTAAEMRAGEHFQAAYHARDSMSNGPFSSGARCTIRLVQPEATLTRGP